MASSIYNSENVNKDIKFLSTHIGGNNDGTKQTFENQLDIINNVESKNKIKYQESINIQSNESTVIGEKNILENGKKISGKTCNLKFVDSFDKINFKEKQRYTYTHSTSFNVTTCMYSVCTNCYCSATAFISMSPNRVVL